MTTPEQPTHQADGTQAGAAEPDGDLPAAGATGATTGPDDEYGPI